MSNDRMIYNGDLGSHREKSAIQNANAVHYRFPRTKEATIQNANAVHYKFQRTEEAAIQNADAVINEIVQKSRRR